MGIKKKVSKARYVISILILIPVLLLLLRFNSGGLLSFKIISNSMYPTLLINDHVIVEVWDEYAPQKGDLIAFTSKGDPNQNLVKRVIGIPGDRISAKGGFIYLNGEREREFKADEIQILVADRRTIKIGKDKVFVLGDNRNNSFDSLDFGTIPYDKIIGKVVYIYWPPSRIGKVE